MRGDYTGEGWAEHTTRKWSLGYTTGPEIDVSWMPEDQYTHRYFREFRIQFLEMMVTNMFRKWFTIIEKYSLKLASVWNIANVPSDKFVFVENELYIVGIFGIFLEFCKNSRERKLLILTQKSSYSVWSSRLAWSRVARQKCPPKEVHRIFWKKTKLNHRKIVKK